jgi:hypothetical protein
VHGGDRAYWEALALHLHGLEKRVSVVNRAPPSCGEPLGFSHKHPDARECSLPQPKHFIGEYICLHRGTIARQKTPTKVYFKQPLDETAYLKLPSITLRTPFFLGNWR